MTVCLVQLRGYLEQPDDFGGVTRVVQRDLDEDPLAGAVAVEGAPPHQLHAEDILPPRVLRLRITRQFTRPQQLRINCSSHKGRAHKRSAAVHKKASDERCTELAEHCESARTSGSMAED